MAEINFINGSYTGKLAQTYGSKWKNKTVLKSTPFSHTPHNQVQRNSWSAFQILNRFSSFFAKQFSGYSSLNFKNKNKINVFTAFFKGLLNNHAFDITNLSKILESQNPLLLESVVFYEELSVVKVVLDNAALDKNAAIQQILVCVMNTSGKIIGSSLVDIKQKNVTVPYDAVLFDGGAVFAFELALVCKKWHWRNACVMEYNLIQNGILYTSRFKTKDALIINNSVAIATENAFSDISQNIAHISNT